MAVKTDKSVYLIGLDGIPFEIVNSEGVIPVLNLLTLMPPYGLKLDAGTSQKLCLIVRDNIAAIDAFDAIAYGFQRFE